MIRGVTMESDLPVLEPQSLKRFFSPFHAYSPPTDLESKNIRLSHKINIEYRGVEGTTTKSSSKAQAHQSSSASNVLALSGPNGVPDNPKAAVIGPSVQSNATMDGGFSGKSNEIVSDYRGSSERSFSTWMQYPTQVPAQLRPGSKWPRPIWRAPWKNYRVISGHLGCVRSVAVDPSNTWFCTGSADRTIKIWDLASGRLKLTLTGHIGQVRGLDISSEHTYMFSAGDDKQVNCWDLIKSMVVRSYHGHLSGVYCLSLHPTLDLIFTGGRDSVCRIWDVRTKMQIHALSGHVDTVCSVFSRPTDPQVVTGSHDGTIKTWDLRMGKTISTLTHHKKSVRALAPHPKEESFASASADNIKKFGLPKGEFLHNMLSQQKTIINAMAVNEEGVLTTAGDNGSLWFWDWASGRNFQQAQTMVQPGSLESEAAIYALTYDVTGSRLISCEADKTIKMWKQDENATPESHPLNFRPPKDIRRF